MVNASSLQNKELIRLCELYGSNARLWLRKFANLLPEVCKRGLYKNANCRSVHEFATKYSGMNRATVDQVILLDRNLEDKPTLRSLLEDYGWSKLRVVANVATKDTDKMWAEKVKKLTKSALEIYVQEWRKKQNTGSGTDDVQGLDTRHVSAPPQQLTGFPGETCCDGNNRLGEHSSLPTSDLPQNWTLPNTSDITNDWTSINIKLDPETEFKLRFLKQKLEKQKREPITFNQVIKYMFEEIEKRETGSAKSLPKNHQENTVPETAENQSGNIIMPNTAKTTETVAQNPDTAQPKPASRYIPASIRRQITDRFQHHCVYPGCNRPADEFHHVKRFASYHQHDPAFMVSLCEAHHKFAHSGLIKNELEEPEKWEVKI